MRKSKPKIKVTVDDAFAMGKIEGAKEAFNDILDLAKQDTHGLMSVEWLKNLLKSKIRRLNTSTLKDAFKKRIIE